MRVKEEYKNDETLVHAYSYMIEVSSQDIPNVRKAYKEYQAAFNGAYEEEKFDNYDAFKKSPYGRNNLFSPSVNQKNAEVIVLKFKNKEDADQFIQAIEQKGIKCTIVRNTQNPDQLPSQDNNSRQPSIVRSH